MIYHLRRRQVVWEGLGKTHTHASLLFFCGTLHPFSSEAQLEEKAVQLDSVDTGIVTTRMDAEDGDKLELSGIGRSAGSPRVLPVHDAGRRHPPRLKVTLRLYPRLPKAS